MDSQYGQFATNRFGDRYLPAINRGAFNSEGSALTFQRHFKGTLAKEETLYIVIGTDSGLLPEYIAREGIPRGSRYLFLEPPSILSCLAETLSPGVEDIRVTAAQDWQQAAIRADIALYFYLDKVTVVRSIGALDGHVPEYRDLARSVEGEIVAWGWRTRTQLGSAVFMRMQLKNAADNQRPAMVLKDLFKGRTGVLLAGGPSLDEQLPWVQKNRESLAVIAVSRISRRLLEFGIAPDIVASVDPHDVSFDVSKEGLKFPDTVLLVHAYHVVPTLLGQWPGPTAYVGPRLPWESPLNLPNINGTGPTVSNTAIDFAHHLGLRQLILCGIDLCHSASGHSHAMGSNEHRLGPRFDDTGLEVETNAGHLARTTPDFLQALKTLEIQAKRHHGYLRLLNPAPGAAKCPGVEHCSLDDIALVAPDVRASELLSAQYPPMPETKARRDLLALRSELLKARKGLTEIQALAVEAIECNKEFFREGAPEKDFSSKKRMDSIEARLNKRYKNLATLLKHFGMPKFMALTRAVAMDEWSEDELMRYGSGYYEAYKASAESFVELIDDALARIASRLDEHSRQPDALSLFKQWESDRQPARLGYWRNRGNAVPAHAQALAEKLDLHYSELFTATTSAHLARTEIQLFRSLAATATTLQSLYDKGDVSKLTSVVEGLSTVSLNAAEHLAHFGHALIAELDGRDADAVDSYQSLITEGKLEELALNRVLGIALRHEDYATAGDVIAALADRSTEYLPSYGRMHAVLGNLEAAANAYEAYLALVPEDTLVLARLCEVRIKQGILEKARELAERIEAITSNPGSARILIHQIEAVSLRNAGSETRFLAEAETAH